jgi:hypothetical protein
MSDPEISEARLHALREEHQALDSAIASMTAQGIYNQLQVQRLKKQKLAVKDAIARLEDKLYPDIIA